MATAYIALGSNRQDPAQQLQSAVRAIGQMPGCHIEAVSRVYRSAAVSPVPQPDYLNAVVRLATGLAPRVLLEALQQIETDQERRRTERWGPRTLDLDILLFDALSLQHPRLQLPHPRMAERDFVLHPLADVAEKKMLLPGGEELGTLLSRCPAGNLQQTPMQLEP